MTGGVPAGRAVLYSSAVPGALSMSMLLLLSVGCSNLVAPPWQPGGSRYASGYAGEETDTATSEDTAIEGDGNAPVLLSGSAEYSENEAGQRYVTAAVAYEDDPDDVAGGRLYYELLGDGALLEEGSRTCTEDSDSDVTESAIVANGILTFIVGPIEDADAHIVIIHVNDYTRNQSNEIQVEVTGE